MKSLRPTKKVTFRYKSALIFGLTSVLPVLLFILVIQQYGLIWEQKVLLILAMGVVTALLGFSFFLRIVNQVSTMARGFAGAEKEGDLKNFAQLENTSELSEMARIADAFNRTLSDLKVHTKELENLVNKLSTLSELTELVSRIPDIKEVIQVVLKRTMAALNAEIGSIMLLDDESGTLSIAASEGLDESVVRDTTVRLGEAIAGKVAQTGEPVVVEDIESDPRFHKSNDPKYESSSFISMPLRVHWRVLGVINLSRKGDRKAFTESDMKFLTTLLGHIGFALENARLLKEAKETAQRLQQMVERQNEELSEAQQQILRTVKLSALGELIAGVAHELNNPLTTVIARSQVLLGDSTDEKMHKGLTKIIDQGQRAARIVKNLLSFARQTPPEKHQVNINDILNGVLEMREYDLRTSNIDVKIEMDPDLPTIMADADQLHQVFLNIVNNAHQAMKEQGKPGCLTIRANRNGNRLTVEIEDTGPGIPREQQKNIFDPFFSTKTKEKGTGLGLSVSHGIVQSHDGNIFVKSEVGKGSSFVVELPLATEHVTEPVEEMSQARDAGLDMQSVLVVDDEENINELISEILTKKGCEVESVRTGAQGLQKLQEHEYDLILCDLRMPGMDGREVYDRAKRINPALSQRFLFLTGDISEQTRCFLQETGNSYLIKPFTLEAFLDAVGQVREQLA